VTSDRLTAPPAPDLPSPPAAALFEGMDASAAAALARRFATVRYRKGELVYSPYDGSHALYVVVDGRVRLYRSAGDGRQLTLAIVDDGMAFGYVGALMAETGDGYAAAMTDAVVQVLRGADLERALAAHPVLALNTARALCERLRVAEDQLESLAFRGVTARLAEKLLDLMDRYGRVTPRGIRIDERFTHVQLAEMIGTSRETLTKVLNELRDGGAVDVRERMLWVLDVAALERLRGTS
jgi:CRP/FNR family cyclic AMP-dependent transcriptional regulator